MTALPTQTIEMTVFTLAYGLDRDGSDRYAERVMQPALLHLREAFGPDATIRISNQPERFDDYQGKSLVTARRVGIVG